MNSTALVVSDDLMLRSQTRDLLCEMGISCTCSSVIGLKRVVGSMKVDAMVLDVGGMEGTITALESVRTGKLNRYSIVLAVVDDGESASAAWAAGANFTVRRSASIQNDLKKAFESAHGLMLREKRRYERHSVDLSVEVTCNGRILIAKMLDLSERGACLECSLAVPGQPLQLSFSLPGLTKQQLTVRGIPAWVRGGRVGIQFTSFIEPSHAVLCEWLSNQMAAQSR